ncbi:hypothetical protein ACQEUU_20975 [Nonomuraea sp. CA-218870]|uniref:hypothetical protein n=1 Tax=Nonomuraea sp. CA-218870 TaxID=3239998 RepID=UPI003D94FF35
MTLRPGSPNRASMCRNRVAAEAPAVLGPLDRARQLEEVADFVIGLAFGGTDPNSAIPRVPSVAA